MKFVAVIFAVVTVASSMPMEQQKCGGFCTAEYDPITCTNRIVYGNACELAKAKVGYSTHTPGSELLTQRGLLTCLCRIVTLGPLTVSLAAVAPGSSQVCFALFSYYHKTRLKIPSCLNDHSG
ncbi:hypothetical protein ACQRIU_007071 [Beauveria bassiana]